jgi:hypothetical protein
VVIKGRRQRCYTVFIHWEGASCSEKLKHIGPTLGETQHVQWIFTNRIRAGIDPPVSAPETANRTDLKQTVKPRCVDLALLPILEYDTYHGWPPH